MKFEDCIIIRKRIKNSRISIRSNGDVIITIPRITLPGHARRLFEDKKGWIDKKIAEISINLDKLIENKGRLLLHGEYFQYICEIGLKNVSVNFENKTITADYGFSEKDKLNHWYKNLAKGILAERFDIILKMHSFSVGRLTIRDQKTRWGSCSGTNNISLNYRLIKCPFKVIDYVILHELVHTIEKNHSKAFWSKLEKYHPEYKESKKWLKDNSISLFN